MRAGSDDPKYRGFSYGVRHTVAAPGTLLEHVDRFRERSELTALELIELGAVYVGPSRAMNPSLRLAGGESVRIHTRPRRYPQPDDLLNRIVEENDDVLVVDKPAGLPVHALVDNINENLISYLEALRGGTLLITHRLDVETSGLVVLAKNAAAQARLNRAFADGTVKRTYAAFVERSVAAGSYVHYMEPSPRAPKLVSPEPHEGWQECRLEVLSCEVLSGPTSLLNEGRTTWSLSRPAESALGGTLPAYARLEIRLGTGRPQQIRAQLAALGAPIVGDANYGSPYRLVDENGRSAVALRAIRVTFV